MYWFNLICVYINRCNNIKYVYIIYNVIYYILIYISCKYGWGHACMGSHAWVLMPCHDGSCHASHAWANSPMVHGLHVMSCMLCPTWLYEIGMAMHASMKITLRSRHSAARERHGQESIQFSAKEPICWPLHLFQYQDGMYAGCLGKKVAYQIQRALL